MPRDASRERLGDRRFRKFPRAVRDLVARPRLTLAIVLFAVAAGGLGLATDWRLPTVILVAWNGAIGVHLGLVLHMMAASDAPTTLRRARRLDEGARASLALSILSGVASLLAVFGELAVVKDLDGVLRLAHVGLAALTVLSAWSFIQVMFALHYAHAWSIASADGVDPGVRIPGEAHPDYWDFLYVAVAVGTSGQTADVEFTGKRLRRVALIHSALAFFFNTTILALTINIAAGLI